MVRPEKVLPARRTIDQPDRVLAIIGTLLVSGGDDAKSMLTQTSTTKIRCHRHRRLSGPGFDRIAAAWLEPNDKGCGQLTAYNATHLRHTLKRQRPILSPDHRASLHRAQILKEMGTSSLKFENFKKIKNARS